MIEHTIASAEQAPALGTATAAEQPQIAHTIVGTVRVLAQVYSPQLDNQRDILVYLPPGYEETDTRYPVVYMHDGQNLFDQATSYTCEWQVDETMELLSQAGYAAIVVGISNRGRERIDEYSPFVDPRHGGGKGRQYVDFIVETLKPAIDEQFRTLRDRTHTGIMGSSMGGLISLYAFACYNAVFGFVGIMSPSLWFADRAIFDVVKAAPFAPGTIYIGYRPAGGSGRACGLPAHVRPIVSTRATGGR
jgi:predicted alpha/beta superfamily hydrolase